MSTPTKTTASAVQVTDATPLDPAWDAVRQTAEQLHTVGRLWLRGQVRLGMQLSALKKAHGIHRGGDRKSGKNQTPESGTWSEIVKRETGYSRQSCDEFIRLYEATIAKLRTSKKLALPAPVKKDALVIFQENSALTLSDEQWALVDDVIGTLTSGETQLSLMQHLGLTPKPKPMPKGGKSEDPAPTDDTAGQLAFHFFEAMVSPLINSRTNPEYKKLLYALPITSSEEHPLSLATLEAECRAILADIDDAKQASAKPTKGKVIQ